MSRATIILIAALCAALAALLVLPKLKGSKQAPPPVATAPPAGPATCGTRPAVQPTRANSAGLQPGSSQAQAIARAVGATGAPVTIIRSDNESMTNHVAETTDLKPLPVLERNYLATTNREDRLDIIMDISETGNADAVKALGRLFAAESDADLKVDLIDSLLTIDGLKDEKLDMLKLGIQPGLPNEVRQSAIDGLIDLEDMRVMALLNGLLNDPNQEIREAAQDAIDLVQTPIQQTPKLK